MTVVAPLALAELDGLDLLEDLPEAERRRWVEAAEVSEVSEGHVLVEQGDPAVGVHLLLRGEARAYRVDGERVEPVSTHRAPTWLGAIAALSDNPVGVRMVCATDCRVALVPAERFTALVLSQPLVHRRIMRQIGPVMSRVAALDQTRERLAGLGTMAAGLAHELNNPAAAARRAAGDLCEALATVSATLGRFVESGVEREEAARLVALQRELSARAESRGPLAALDAADAEEAMLELLDELGVADGYRIAEPLAAAGADEAWVRAVSDAAGPARDAALGWVAASLTANGLAAEIRDSAERMSRLVGAVKSYTFMDRGEMQETDLHEGLETTLAVLGHKLKHTHIKVTREYARDLPRVTVYGGELNQVWTNLLDNAIDALGQDGHITVRTRRDGPCALVEIEDNGPGIPVDARTRIFEPFYTTKGVGRGTGLGLDTVRRIVAERHGGSITVDSEPGRTVFHVWLPLRAG